VDVRNCKRCKKIFNYLGNPLCHACIKKTDLEFERVRNFLYEFPGSSMEEVCEETGVCEVIIRNWLREGRLILSQNNAGLLQCQSCGIPIVTGQLCDRCIAKVRGSGADLLEKIRPAPEVRDPGQTSKGKMHVRVRQKNL